MPRTPVTDQLLQDLLATASADRVPFVHVAAVVEHHHAILLLHGGDGYAFNPAAWQLPTGTLLAGHDTPLDVVHRVTTCTAGLDLDQVTSYLGCHDHRSGDAIIRTFAFTVTVTDPTRMRRNALFGHQWIQLTRFPLPLPGATTAASRHFACLAAGMPTATPTRPEPALAEALRANARGLYAAEAATELLIGSPWLHRADFTRFVHTGTYAAEDATAIADIDWASAINALDAGDLPCSAGETRLLRLAASISEGLPVDLRRTLTGLDDTTIDLTVQAVQHAAGRRPASPHL